MATATVHTVADRIVASLQHDLHGAREVLAFHSLNGAQISLELESGQRFYLSILEDDSE
jgi:hypothetical protein